VATSPPTPTLYPLSSVSQFWHVGSCAGRNQSCQSWLDRFRGFGAPGGRKSLSPIDWRYRPYNSEVSVRTNVLHCDYPITAFATAENLPLWTVRNTTRCRLGDSAILSPYTMTDLLTYHIIAHHGTFTGQLSLATPSWVGAMSTSQRAVMPCGWGVKVGKVK